MVRSIEPNVKKAGCYAQAMTLQRLAEQPPLSARLWGPFAQQISLAPWRRQFWLQSSSLWRLPWICWVQLSIPVSSQCWQARNRAKGGLTGGWGASPLVYRGAIVSTPTDGRRIVAQYPQIDFRHGGVIHTRHCAKPCTRMSLGRSIPMNTILLLRSSPSAHAGPRSLPMSWCTP